MVLQNLKTLESYLGDKVDKVLQFLHISMILNVKQLKMPVKFGLEVERIINEPTAH